MAPGSLEGAAPEDSVDEWADEGAVDRLAEKIAQAASGEATGSGAAPAGHLRLAADGPRRSSAGRRMSTRGATTKVYATPAATSTSTIAGSFRAVVSGLAGELATVEADRHWNVAQLKCAVQQATRIRHNEQELCSGSVRLQDFQFLSALPAGDVIALTLFRVQLLRLCVVGSSLRLLNITGEPLLLFPAQALRTAAIVYRMGLDRAFANGAPPGMYRLEAGAEFIIEDWEAMYPHQNLLVVHPLQGGDVSNSDQWRIERSEGTYSVTKVREWKRH